MTLKRSHSFRDESCEGSFAAMKRSKRCYDLQNLETDTCSSWEHNKHLKPDLQPSLETSHTVNLLNLSACDSQICSLFELSSSVKVINKETNDEETDDESTSSNDNDIIELDIRRMFNLTLHNI